MQGAVVQMLGPALAIVVAEGLVEGLVVEGWLHEGVVQDGHGALGVAAMLHLTWTVEVSGPTRYNSPNFRACITTD